MLAMPYGISWWQVTLQFNLFGSFITWRFLPVLVCFMYLLRSHWVEDSFKPSYPLWSISYGINWWPLTPPPPFWCLFANFETWNLCISLLWLPYGISWWQVMAWILTIWVFFVCLSGFFLLRKILLLWIAVL